MSTRIEQANIDQFQRDGATILRGYFKDWIDILRAGVAENVAKPNPNARIYNDEEGGGRFFVDYCSWQRIPAYRDFIFNSDVASIAKQLMQSEQVQLFHEHVLIKEAKTNIATPWHQDMPYYCVDCPQTISLWIPLDEVPRERTLEFVAGSHKWDKNYRPLRFNGQPLNSHDDNESIPDIDANRQDYQILGWDLQPGDAVAFDYRTIHGAPANNSKANQRRAFSLRLLGDNPTFVRIPGLETSPPFEQIQLAHGDVLIAEEFPLLST